MATKLTPAEKKLLGVCRETLDSIILERSNDIEADSEVVIDENTRYRMKDRVMVDSAVGQMWAVILSKHFDLLRDVKDHVPVWREAYHHAVNAYFRLYFGRKRGQPALEEEACRELLDMRGRGLSYAQIGLKLNLDREVIRKRVKACERRFAEGGKNSAE